LNINAKCIFLRKPMEQRVEQRKAINTGKAETRPPVVIEEWTFDRGSIPEGILQSQSELGRKIEYELSRHICSYELINDDKVVPQT
jgi:hypothetical protein